MSAQQGYPRPMQGQPARNPFAQQQQAPPPPQPLSYPQPTQNYSDHGSEDGYGSTTRLTSGAYDSACSPLLRMEYILNLLIGRSSQASSDPHYQSRSYAPSIESHASQPTGSPFGDPGHGGSTEPYPAWSVDRQIPISTEEIEDIFLDLTHKFGFQRDSMRNMVCDTFYTTLS